MPEDARKGRLPRYGLRQYDPIHSACRGDKQGSGGQLRYVTSAIRALVLLGWRRRGYFHEGAGKWRGCRKWKPQRRKVVKEEIIIATLVLVLVSLTFIPFSGLDCFHFSVFLDGRMRICSEYSWQNDGNKCCNIHYSWQE